jgi:cysteinyl-tRNA synthetase
MALVDQRQYAKKEKRFKNADEIRAQVESLGYAIEDTPHGPRVKVKS